ERLELRRATHRERHLVFRFIFGVTGAVILAAGLVMLVTPGPAFVLIPIGLAMLSMEFVWAERLLDKSLEQAAKAQQKAAETTTTQRVMAAVATLLGLAAAALAVLWWDIPLLPDS
ncbi:MAG TPA: PGPGW domain-containing protein, partial [Solirubrobacteraceae bacterium]|nr:PGPGW domain-containing protein [Solirubrobacteraceae bacterium]